MAMTEAALRAALTTISDNLQKVYSECDRIGNAVAEMYKVVEDDCFPLLVQVQEAWMGGTSDRYVQKTNEKVNDIVQDCLDLRKAAEDILAKYLEYSKGQLRALGVDPKTVWPDL